MPGHTLPIIPASKAFRSRPFRLLFIFSCFTFCTLAAHSRQTPLPPAFHRLASDGQRAVFLRKIIGDSVRAGAFTHIPAWTHLALRYVQVSGADSLLPMLYQLLGDAYETTQFDSAAHYYLRSLLSYKVLPPQKNLYLYQSLLYAFMAVNGKDSVRKYMNALGVLRQKLSDSDPRKTNLTNTLAQAHNMLSEYEETVALYNWVIQKSRKVRDTISQRNALVNIGTVYVEMENIPQGIYHTLQALPFLGNDEYTSMVVYTNLAQYYQQLERGDSARMFWKKAAAIAIPSGDLDAIHSVQLSEAAILLLEKNYAPVAPLLQKSLAFFETQPRGVQIVNCLLIFATLDTLQGNFVQAETHLKQLYPIAAELQGGYLLQTLQMLVRVNERLADWKEAFRYTREAEAIREKVKTEKTARALASLQNQYQSLKKEEQIDKLQLEAKASALRLGNERRTKALYGVVALFVIAAISIAYYLRHLQYRSGMQKLKGDLEMKALRSQMNPHFIFNSLNSIQKYIWENRQEDASNYLTKFARLIRRVLENSLHPSVKLTEELDALRLYIDMEHRRNNGRFDYSIAVDPAVPEGVRIPPLLLQPYVENAIWHGLSQKEGRGKLSIQIGREGALLQCRIDDDGIGRTQAAAMKSTASQTKSLAMNISNQRIEWLKRDTGTQASVSVEDLYLGNESAGTSVMLTLPLNIQ